MEKLISDSKRKRIERNENIRKDFAQYMSAGSDRTATYDFLSKKYGLAQSTIIVIVSAEKSE